MTTALRICPDCGLAAVPDFRFCPSCGIPLEQAATEAGTGSATDGGAIAEERPAWTAERRLVSVLFMDLVGFTGISEQLDPEDVREVQSRYFEAARSTVSHYGGSLEKFIGDAVMAVWGTPVARENDAERAARAALEMLRKVAAIGTPTGGRLRARAAITTGEAAVTLDIDGEGMVTGDLVNTASRLQEAAMPGALLVDEATRRAVGDAFDLEEAGEQALKGKAIPVAAWRVAESEPGVAGESQAGHGGPFVGRVTELRRLEELLRSTLDEQRLTLVSIIGVAGIGKSRLAWELERRTGAPDGLRWHAGRPPRWGHGTAYAPLAEMVRRSLAVAETEPSEVVRRAVSEALNRLIPDTAEREWMHPRLMTLLEGPVAAAPGDRVGEPLEGEREELFAAWRRYLEADADEAPLVLVFEDLQWAAPELLDFIDYLASWSRRRRIFVLALARPELLESRPTWGAGMPNFTAMHLDRLADEEVDALLQALAPRLPGAVAARVRQRAEGVPLYAVEMARFVEAGGTRAARDAASMPIPESLHALIAARIDALAVAERSLLLTAAVLGRRFRPEALAALTDIDRTTLGRRLGALVRREFLSIDDEPGSPGRGGVSFVQDLVREVAYNILSRRERRARHLAVIEYLESSQDPDRVEPMADHLVAAHAAYRADQPEAGALAVRAREALRLAADRAKAMHAPQRALSHLERALALSGDPQARADLLEAAGGAARAAARFSTAEAHLREAIDIRDSLGDQAGSTRHRAQLASLLLQAQRSETALAELEAAWESAEGGKDSDATAQLPAELARAHLLRGDPDRAVEWARRALATSPGATDDGSRALAIDARVTLGSALAQRSAPEEGLQELRQAIDEAAEAGLGAVELRARNNLAWLLVEDDPRATIETARRGLELAERLGHREWSLNLLDVASIVAVDVGEWDWAIAALHAVSDVELPTAYRLDFAATRAIIEALRDSVDPLRPIERLGTLEPDLDPLALGWVEIARALVDALRGDGEAAQRQARIAAQRTVGWERVEALALAGRIAAWNGDATAAAEALRDLEAEASWGRAAGARHRTLRAAVAALRSRGTTPSRTATRDWNAALRAWRDLQLPLRLGLCLLDRWRLAGDGEARSEAEAVFSDLGASALVRLLREDSPKLARRTRGAGPATRG
jgi:class 3 adenylate cyclase/tetratricopeptide (TPR) repeat protein